MGWLKYLSVFLCIYTIALLSSNGLMELFSWLSAITVLLYLALRKGERIFLRTGQDWMICGFVIVCALSLVVNEAPDGEKADSFGSLRWLPLMYLLAIAFSKVNLTKKWFFILTGIAGAIGVYGVVQHFTGMDYVRGIELPRSYHGVQRATGLFSSSITYAYTATMFICLPFAALILGLPKKRWESLLLVNAVVAIGCGVLFSYSRGAWLGGVAAVMAMTFLVNRKQFLRALVGMAVVGLIAVATNKNLRVRAISIFTPSTHNSSSIRLMLWEASWRMFKDNPMLGVGLDQSSNHLMHYYSEMGITEDVFLKMGRSWFIGHSHSNYFEYLATTGIFGLIFYLLFSGYFVWLAFCLWRKIPPEELFHRVLLLGIFGALVSFHVSGITESSFKDNEVNHMLIVFMAYLMFLRYKYLSPRGEV